MWGDSLLRTMNYLPRLSIIICWSNRTTNCGKIIDFSFFQMLTQVIVLFDQKMIADSLNLTIVISESFHMLRINLTHYEKRISDFETC